MKNNIIDMHCDTVYKMYQDESLSLTESSLMVDLNKLEKGGYLMQCFAMFVPYYSRKNESDYSPQRECLKMIDKYYRQLEQNSDRIAPVLKFDDIEKNVKDGKISALLTVEEGGVLNGEIQSLERFYKLGVRMITLTWNYVNGIASPNYDMLKINGVLPTEPNITDGLTEFGVKAVKEMNRLGIIVDCSHLGDKGFFDVIKTTSKPIACSHSCARSVAKSLRNMTDDMLFALKDNGGIVGINFCHDFVKDDKSRATVKNVVEHINYIKNLIGVEYIGIGSDFDGISNEDIEIKDASEMNLLIAELQAQGYTEEEIDKITHLNFLRVLKANLKI